LVLLVVRNEALGDGLASGIGLGNLASTTDCYIDAQASKLAGTDHIHGLHNLRTERLRENLGNRDAVHANVALRSLRHRSDSNSRLLLAEGLHLLVRVALLSSHFSATSGSKKNARKAFYIQHT
ncbi:hypothetical protein TcCL_Unassigned06067, partial [Trypanosoma cruzi]